ncbi:MAG TPA: phage tail assembly chaperone [Hyphomicrobiaceae bacterium]|nr:phage tail assembly chaperone [Hyphomicrobiaceae bacterium]
MAAGLGTLRLTPAVFWSMTPKELAAALRPLLSTVASDPPPRAALAALMTRYPDGTQKT